MLHSPRKAGKYNRPKKLTLVKAIYESLIDPEIKEMVGLHKNMQAEVAPKVLSEKVLPFVADKLFSHPVLLLEVTGTFRHSFVRYVTKKISAEDQELADRLFNKEAVDISKLSKERQENIHFLMELTRRRRSDDRYENASCKLISLACKMVCNVLKIAFSRSYNRNYGWDPEHDDGRVIPYLAVGKPSTTRFGNVYLALAYQFQRALNTPISKGEISFLAKKMYSAAEFYAKNEMKPFLDTAEAKQFARLTSMSLLDISTDKGLEEAYQWINDPNHLERRLDFEAEVAPFLRPLLSQESQQQPHQWRESV